MRDSTCRLRIARPTAHAVAIQCAAPPGSPAAFYNAFRGALSIPTGEPEPVEPKPGAAGAAAAFALFFLGAIHARRQSVRSLALGA